MKDVYKRQATITSVRAVVEDSGQRCWVEPQQVAQERGSNPNVPGALLGAVIGGILGHQVGGGSGKDIATGIGLVAGAAIGANTGQQVTTTQNLSLIHIFLADRLCCVRCPPHAPDKPDDRIVPRADTLIDPIGWAGAMAQTSWPTNHKHCHASCPIA